MTAPTHTHERCPIDPAVCCGCGRPMCPARDALTANPCILEEGHEPPVSLGETWDHLGPFPLAWRVIGDVTATGRPVQRTQHQDGEPVDVRFWTLSPTETADRVDVGDGWVGIVDRLDGDVVAYVHPDRADAVIAGLLAAT